MATVPPSRTTAARPRPSNKQQHLRYTSPRCELEDDEVLPCTSLETHDERWKHIQEQAGSHQQDGSVLDLTSRQTITPQTLKVGVPPQVASRVRELHVDFDSSHSLPEWLDVVCSLFFQLQHLYTCSNYEESESIPTQDARMRRLYILYRLPDLLSIDGKKVTLVERQLARPSSPNGHRVKREDWIVSDDDDDSTVSSEDDSSVLQNHGDAVEVSLFGVVKRVSADPPKEEFDEPQLPKPYEPQKSEVTTSVTKSVERSHRTMGKASQQKEQGVKTPSSSSCGGLAAAFADGNPCVGSRRTTSLDEPHTLDYPTTDTMPQRQTDRSAVPNDSQGNNNRRGRGSRSQTAVPLYKKQQGSELMKKKKQVDVTTSPERLPEQKRPTTPEAKTSPSSSLSSPFPMQFRSKSFNGALPSRARRNNGGRLPRKMSSPDLSPEKISRGKGTIDSPVLPSSPKGIMPRQQKQQQRAERPPPCPPGSSRRVAPAASTPTRRSWRSKNSIRSTSIVDDDEEEEDYISDDEDVIEHE